MNATSKYLMDVSAQKLSRDIRAMERRRRAFMQRLITTIVILVVSIIAVKVVVTLNDYRTQINNLTNELAIAQDTIEDLFLQKEAYKKLAEAVPELVNTTIEQETIINGLIEDNTSLAAEYDQVSAAYDTLKIREELYDKYSYAIMYDGKRTDLTYDQLSYGEELMIAKGLDPDLLFAIGMTESRFVEKAKNKESTASGYFQILKGTGKFIYANLLNNPGTYNHSVQFNGYKSIESATTYIDFLVDDTNKAIYSVIQRYSGRDQYTVRSYINEMNKFLATKGKSVKSLDLGLS